MPIPVSNADARAPRMTIATRGLARDPLALPVGERTLRIETGSDLHADPGAPGGHARNEADVDLARLVGHDTALHRNAGGAQAFEALTRNQRIGVFHRRDHARDAGRDQCVRARRRAPEMTAGLERHAGGRTARIEATRFRVVERFDLCVRTAGRLRRAFADDRAVLDEHASHARVRIAAIERVMRALESAAHPAMRVERV